MKYVIAFAILMLLPSCKTMTPAVEVRTVEIAVDRPVYCLEAKDIPAKPKPLEKRPDNAQSALDVAMAKLVELMGAKLDGSSGYIAKADSALRGCLPKI